MAASALSTHVQSILAESLTNISSSNPNTPSHHVRKEGWTEVYGNVALQANLNSKKDSSTQSAKPKSSDIQLLQYRTEWSTQLLLRIYSIPHRIRNSPYISNQATGALPQYQNLQKQILIGNRDILPYLANDLHLQKGLSKEQTSEHTCLDTLIDGQNLILQSLRYADYEAWEQIYRPQCIRASTLHSSFSKQNAASYAQEDDGDGTALSRLGHWNGFAWFQAWAERAVYMKQVKLGHFGILLNSANTNATATNNSNGQSKEVLHVEKLIQMAKEGYQALDTKVALGEGTLLGTNALTFADIKLFGHLAEALCDVHLVTLLAEYKNLIAFFQNVYQKYFGKEYLRECILEDATSDEDLKGDVAKEIEGKFQWIKDNDLVNALNQFNRLPMNAKRAHGSLFKGKGVNGGYQDAIKIMQEVALHCHDLQEVLVDMAMQKKKEDASVAKDSVGKNGVGSMLHKFLMGAELKMKKGATSVGGVDEDSDEEDDEQDDVMKKNKQHMKNMIKKAKKSDEIWISGVVAITVIGLLASSSAASE
mmetsp:Transcript_24465/g.36249  ORF Transcript_24465/g.36249 Transcript_24465/m.36249 type:complete len:536 (+) Transcript_24465:205-1812(+)